MRSTLLYGSTLVLYCLVKKKDKYIVDVTLDVIIVRDATLIMDKLYILLITKAIDI